MEQADLTVRRIKDGTVIDHIDVGNGLKVLEALRINGSGHGIGSLSQGTPRSYRTCSSTRLYRASGWMV